VGTPVKEKHPIWNLEFMMTLLFTIILLAVIVKGVWLS
jgi:hypothetical protein